ncbi:hypothetical protein ABEV34_12430 [Methylorubrum rhodesianum]|nr:MULTISPECIES: hypothetical protein [Methylorubrum]
MNPMKKRARTTGRIRARRLALGGGSRERVRRRPEYQAIEQSVQDTGIVTLVSEQTFDSLLTLLDKPPEVSDELRREVAQRRWK